MNQLEYFTKNVSHTAPVELNDALNEFGQDGWAVAHIQPVANDLWVGSMVVLQRALPRPVGARWPVGE